MYGNERLEREADFHDLRFSGRLKRNVSKFYSIAKGSSRAYRRRLQRLCPGKRVLEYGCGPGSAAFDLAAQGARVTGIDISKAAIDRARSEAARRGLSVRFEVANAEAMDFEDGAFDLVCGSGILHHLDLELAYAEIQRVLSPQGQAVFLEPLGHNPLINAFRHKTPGLRTEDEHPLLMEDLERSRQFFGVVDTEYFHLTTLAAVPIRTMPVFTPIVDILYRFDRMLFKAFPYLTRHAWMIIIGWSRPAPVEVVDSSDRQPVPVPGHETPVPVHMMSARE